MTPAFSCANCALGPADKTGCDRCNCDARYPCWKHKEFIGHFPLILSNKDKEYTELPFSVPWALIMPYERQAIANHGQTLLQLAKRGGLCPVELLAVMEQRSWVTMPLLRAWQIIRVLMGELWSS